MAGRRLDFPQGLQLNMAPTVDSVVREEKVELHKMESDVLSLLAEVHQLTQPVTSRLFRLIC